MESNGETVNIQNRRNETSLIIRGGSIIFRQDSRMTAVDRYSFLVSFMFSAFF